MALRRPDLRHPTAIVAWVAAILIVVGVVGVVAFKVLPACWREHPTWSVWSCVDEAVRSGGPFAPPRPRPKAIAPTPPPRLTLSWTDNSSGTAGVRIERRTAAESTFTEIAAVPPGVFGYVDTAVAPGVTYCYRVKAHSQAGESGYSGEACRTVAAALEVTVATRGTGQGTVLRNPSGSTGSAGNSASYPIGTIVTLTATPAAGSVFAGWSGSGCQGTQPCTVTGNGTITVTARFDREGIAQPALLEPVETTTVAPGSVMTFAWSGVTGATQYGFEFTGTNRRFANPNGTAPDGVNGFSGAGGGFLVAGTTVTLTLPADVPAGTYQVRVIGLAATGQVVGRFSDAISVVIERRRS